MAVGVANASAVRDTYRRLVAHAARAAPGAAVDRVVVQAMVRDAVAEAILGVSRQPPFGPTLLYGLGGLFLMGLGLRAIYLA